MPDSERTTGIRRLLSSPTSAVAEGFVPLAAEADLQGGIQVLQAHLRETGRGRCGAPAVAAAPPRPSGSVAVPAARVMPLSVKRNSPPSLAQHLAAAAHFAAPVEAHPLQLAQEIGAQAQRAPGPPRARSRGGPSVERQAQPRAVAAELRARRAAGGQDDAPGLELAARLQEQGQAVLLAGRCA